MTYLPIVLSASRGIRHSALGLAARGPGSPPQRQRGAEAHMPSGTVPRSTENRREPPPPLTPRVTTGDLMRHTRPRGAGTGAAVRADRSAQLVRRPRGCEVGTSRTGLVITAPAPIHQRGPRGQLATCRRQRLWGRPAELAPGHGAPVSHPTKTYRRHAGLQLAVPGAAQKNK